MARWFLLSLVTTFSVLLPVDLVRAADHPRDTASYREKIDRTIDRGLSFLASQQVGEDGRSVEAAAGARNRPEDGTPDNGPLDKENKGNNKKNKAAKAPQRAKGGANGAAEAGAISDSLKGNVGVTSLCVMAFLSKGHTPGLGPYGDTINQALDFVLDQQDEKGMLISKNPQGRSHGPMYSHCIATLLLAETTGMVDPQRQRRIDRALPKALTLIIKAQQIPKPANHAGGWRYQPDSKDSDLSLTGWAIMALRAGKLNGAAVPAKNIDAAMRYVLRCRQPQSGGFAYTPGGQPNPGLTAAAILCMELCGLQDHKAIQPAGEYLLEHQAKKYDNDMKAVYAAYYCGQAAFQLGPDYWESYAPRMYENLLAGQQADGGWPITGNIGRCFTTAMSILAMTPSYQQLPIYQRDESFHPWEADAE